MCHIYAKLSHLTSSLENISVSLFHENNLKVLFQTPNANFVHITNKGKNKQILQCGIKPVFCKKNVS